MLNVRHDTVRINQIISKGHSNTLWGTRAISCANSASPQGCFSSRTSSRLQHRPVSPWGGP
eukprot:5404124-Amphidinium_carterae.1